WVALFESGVDPVIVGVAMGLLAMAYPAARRDLEHATDLFRLFREQPTSELARSARERAHRAVPERAAAAALSPALELRDRAAVRARQRGNRGQGKFLGAGVRLAGHPRNHHRVRGGKADRDRGLD